MRVFAAAAAVFAAAAVAPVPARAIGPHEIVLVVNDESVDSILLARVYQRLRSVPDANLIRISIPKNVYDGVSTDISPQDFAAHIWAPLNRAVEKAGLARQMLAVVFSCGFPTRVTTPEMMSLTGAVFVRGKFPAEKDIANGSYISDLYAGPSNAETPIGASETFDTSRNRLINAMPLPAMMLAFTGARGSTVDEAMEYLERAALGDYTRPDGPFWFAVNDDIRTTCRLWEFAPVAAALEADGRFRAVVSTNQPGVADFPLSGYMTGARNVKAASFSFHPGAFAENLTSFGATFDVGQHTKITEWLKNGAAFSAGTVCEPLSIWMKFPHACIFYHYANGCTAIESFYQSVRCPLQTLPIGDPLANPWGEAVEARIDAPEGSLSGLVTLTASLENERADVFYRFQWLVDGVAAGTARSFVWDTRKASDGAHVIRVVARRQLENVKHQGFAEARVVVDNKK